MTHEEFKQALESLQEGLYAKWEANTRVYCDRYGKEFDEVIDCEMCFPLWIDHGFTWISSPEGYEFWKHLHDNLELPEPQLTYWFVSFAHKQGFSSAHVSSESKYFDVKAMKTRLADMGYEAAILFYKEIPKEEYELNTQSNGN